jgi:hypothetical protein
VDTAKAWAQFDLQIPHLTWALFESATSMVLGNGEKALLWKDRWLQRDRLLDYTLNLVAMVSAREVGSYDQGRSFGRVVA